MQWIPLGVLPGHLGAGAGRTSILAQRKAPQRWNLRW